ncbi:hypothetical protein GCM10009863_37470 [Streptomyces axinellae]|uniref:Uncharacterized protein n=1 Tax=Streptomyces axinellae TaxID=552788 RepID=A0ABN3Q9B9_9ACTN
MNGTVGPVMAPRGHLFPLLAFTRVDDRITETDIIAPARLATLDLAVLDA